MKRDTSAWFFKMPSAEVESLLSIRVMNIADLFPSRGAAMGFALSSTAHAGKLLGMKYHWDFYLCQNWGRLADRLKKILWKLIDRDTYTLLHMVQNSFPKKKKKVWKWKWSVPEQVKTWIWACWYGLMDSLWRQTALLRFNEQYKRRIWFRV